MSGWTQPTVYVENEKEMLVKFAELTLQYPDQPLLAVQKLFPDKSEEWQFRCSSSWNVRPDVKLLRYELVEKRGFGKYLPKKEDIASEILKMAREANKHSEKLASYKLLCDIMGFIDKAGSNVTINNTVNNRVMEVPLISNKEDFNADMAKEQEQLTSYAETRH